MVHPSPATARVLVGRPTPAATAPAAAAGVTSSGIAAAVADFSPGARCRRGSSGDGPEAVDARHGSEVPGDLEAASEDELRRGVLLLLLLLTPPPAPPSEA